jgi:hypothetical protein
MGMILTACSPPSAYSVKRDRPDLWADLVDRIEGALTDSDLREFEAWLDFRPLDLPGGWSELLEERIEKRREELRDEDIPRILLDRYDFT